MLPNILVFIIEQKQSAREIAVNYLLEEIKNGSLIAGDKILNERKLSDKLGISRVPLREGLKKRLVISYSL